MDIRIKINAVLSDYQAGMIYGFAWSLMQNPDIEIQDTARQVFESMQPQMVKHLGQAEHDNLLNLLAQQAEQLHEQNHVIIDYIKAAEKVRNQAKNN